jgi:hypothetical protein
MDSERTEQDWIEANAQRVNDALSRPEVRTSCTACSAVSLTLTRCVNP